MEDRFVSFIYRVPLITGKRSVGEAMKSLDLLVMELDTKDLYLGGSLLLFFWRLEREWSISS